MSGACLEMASRGRHGTFVGGSVLCPGPSGWGFRIGPSGCFFRRLVLVELTVLLNSSASRLAQYPHETRH